MNRIILIGNGFDLAHGLKTSYKDFIEWFWETKATKIKNNRGKEFEDDDIVIKAGGTWHHWQGNTTNYQDLEYNIEQGNIKREYKNKFLEQISDISKFQNWVDIEEEYFTQLKTIIKNQRISGLSGSQSPRYSINDLNKDFENIKKSLEDYLIGELKNFKSDSFDLKNISQTFNFLDFTFQDIRTQQEFEKYLPSRSLGGYKGNETPLYPNKTLFLNFNYTDLSTKLIKYIQSGACLSDDWAKNSFDDLFIHGRLENKNFPIIFGYGDEQDEIQKELEKRGGDYLNNIKTINYLKTPVYKYLLTVVAWDLYQIFIWGHSCGLSDKTLLNTLFEHKNCVSIKPFYYTDENEDDNYGDIVKNIYRCFGDKVQMREKVVNKSFCSELYPSKAACPAENVGAETVQNGKKRKEKSTVWEKIVSQIWHFLSYRYKKVSQT
jgi:hypothetical protein